MRDAVLAAAKAFEHAGANVVEVEPVMTRAMLDGVDDFFRARSWADLESYEPEARAKILPYILTWAEKGATHVRRRRRSGATTRPTKCAKPRRGCFETVDLVLSPTAPVVDVPGRMGLADQRSRSVRSSTSSSPCRGTWPRTRPPRSTAASPRHGHADRPADRRPALRRPDGAARREILRDLARADHELAEAEVKAHRSADASEAQSRRASAN